MAWNPNHNCHGDGDGDAADAEPKKRGRPAKVSDEAAEIMSYQR